MNTKKIKIIKKNKSLKKFLSLDNFILPIPNILKKNMNSYPKLYNVDTNNFMPWSDISSDFIATKNLKSQIYINNGMKLLYNFNQEEACNNFIFAAILDPKCAFAFWGISYSLQLNINHIIIPSKILKFAVNAYKIAYKLKDNAEPIIKDLIEALYYRIIPKGKTLKSNNNILSNPSFQEVEIMMTEYNEKMKKIYKKFSSNSNIAVLYVSSIMTIKPWKWWPTGDIYNTSVEKPNHGDILAKAPKDMETVIYILFNTLVISPGHIGALHYLIHAIEESPYPILGLGAAIALQKTITNLGHLLHMPSHIYSRLGMYNESIKQNIKAIKADNDFIAYKKKNTKNNLLDSYYNIEYYAHNIHFLIVDSERMGNYKICSKYIPLLEKHINKYISLKGNLFLEHFLTIKIQLMLRFGKYKEIININPPNSHYKFWTSIYYYCVFVSYCKTYNQEKAIEYYKLFIDANNIFISQAPKETCRCGCSKRHGGISNPNYGMNKTAYFKKQNIDIEKLEESIENEYNINTNYNLTNKCCNNKTGLGYHKSQKPGGLIPATEKIRGTYTINNSKLVALIFQELADGYLEWYFGKKNIAILNFKKATQYYEDLQYDEPASFFYSVHQTYALALYMMKEYEEALKIATRGNIPYPNQIRITNILYLCNINLNKYESEQILKEKYETLLKYADYIPNLKDF